MTDPPPTRGTLDSTIHGAQSFEPLQASHCLVMLRGNKFTLQLI